jgi:hypothetical protein
VKQISIYYYFLIYFTDEPASGEPEGIILFRICGGASEELYDIPRLTLIDSALGGHDIEENKTPKTPDRNEQAKKKRKQSSEAPNPTVNGMKIFNANFLNSEKAAVLLAQKNSKISMLSLKVSVGVISNAQLCDEIEQIQTEYDNLLRENDYPDLYDAIRDLYGLGSVINTFKIPDYRGYASELSIVELVLIQGEFLDQNRKTCSKHTSISFLGMVVPLELLTPGVLGLNLVALQTMMELVVEISPLKLPETAMVAELRHG